MVRVKCCIFLEIEFDNKLWHIYDAFKTILFLSVDTGIQEATAAESTISLPQPTTGNKNTVVTLS